MTTVLTMLPRVHSLSSIVQPPSDFSINNPPGCLAAFRAFLRSEFSEENIEFWLACRDYRKTISPADLFWKATEIYQEFLHPQAQREINVDHHIHEKIKRSMKAPALCCFDEAVRHVYKLMESDSYSRFLRSDAYLGLRRKARTFW
ncbi:unnamed protein product [Oncorhynchus mykiss]|uniref:RGS domain-containing protein n=1 Tax=Oncorhynchus mykiss TaxID=8022 RepID=A0A061A7M7_ONCMY|nr:unnamed protein product [Oncorhynchus mykiss]